MLKKILIMVVLVLLSFVILVGCTNDLEASQEYEKSFKKIWDTLMEKNTKTNEKNKEALEVGDIDEVIKTYQSLEEDNRKAKKELNKLTPPEELQKLHILMKADLEAGMQYASWVAKVLSETEGNYSADQEKQLKTFEDAWLQAEKGIKEELKKQGFTLEE